MSFLTLHHSPIDPKNLKENEDIWKGLSEKDMAIPANKFSFSGRAPSSYLAEIWQKIKSGLHQDKEEELPLWCYLLVYYSCLTMHDIVYLGQYFSIARINPKERFEIIRAITNPHYWKTCSDIAAKIGAENFAVFLSDFNQDFILIEYLDHLQSLQMLDFREYLFFIDNLKYPINLLIK